MNEDSLNIEIRKFLKKVGIRSQREIEKAVYNAEKVGKIKIGNSINLIMTLEINELNLKHTIEENINIE